MHDKVNAAYTFFQSFFLASLKTGYTFLLCPVLITYYLLFMMMTFHVDMFVIFITGSTTDLMCCFVSIS